MNNLEAWLTWMRMPNGDQALLGIPTKAASISQVLQMNECIEGIWWVVWLQNFLYLCFYV